MDALKDLLDHYRSLIATMQEEAVSLESGRWRLYDGPDHDREISGQWAAKQRETIARLEQIVAAYERRDAAP